VFSTLIRGRAFRSGFIAFVALNALNIALGLVWLFIGAPLRGMDYEPGRPTPEDLFSMRVVEVTVGALVAVNLAVPGYFALRKRFASAAGCVLAWATSPVLFWPTVAALAATRIAFE
jgi:hypothetical protein